jgi:hypothetical protein
MNERKGGRPGKYSPAHAEEARRRCAGGAVMRELAELWEVEPRTITVWRKAHPELEAAISEGRAEAKQRRAAGGLEPRRRERVRRRYKKAEFLYVGP